MTNDPKVDPLFPDFRLKVLELKRICLLDGVEILIYCGLRTCSEQARLFRQSRGREEIQKKQQSLRDRDLGFLADIIDTVGPQPGTIGKHVTKAGPGESWHQYLMAADGVPLRNGKAMWSSDDPGWQTYGAAARHLGLTWAGDWKGFREMPHVQLHHTNNPVSYFKDPARIREYLEENNCL